MFNPPSESQYDGTARRSAEDKKDSFTVQALLIGRQKALSDMDWIGKYADSFRDLFASDDAFAAAVRDAAKAITEIQAKLDARLSGKKNVRP